MYTKATKSSHIIMMVGF